MTQEDDYLPTEEEIRDWCRYFQSTWTPEQEQERAGSGVRIRAVLREVRVPNCKSHDYLLDDSD
jgi:hypothetical protein